MRTANQVIIEALDHNLTAFALYMLILERWEPQTSFTLPLDRAMRWLGKSRNTTRRAFEALSNAGLVTTKGQTRTLHWGTKAHPDLETTRLVSELAKVAGERLPDPFTHNALIASQGIIRTWLESGANFDRHIRPAVALETWAVGKPPINSWNYFTPIIQRAMAQDALTRKTLLPFS